MGIKVLFVYPNTYGMNMLPPAIALFSALLKERGHEVDLFDATYYQTDHGVDSDGTKADRLNVVPFSQDEKGIKMRETDWRSDIHAKIPPPVPSDLIFLAKIPCRHYDDKCGAEKSPLVRGGSATRGFYYGNQLMTRASVWITKLLRG